MSRRRLEEINAGSMADIAFLLLIFFIVTASLSLEEGIPKILPEKVSIPTDAKIHERDLFSININDKNELLVETKTITLDVLAKQFYTYYTVNEFSADIDKNQPNYKNYTYSTLLSDLNNAQLEFEKDPGNKILESKVKRLKRLLTIIKLMPNQKLNVINDHAAVQITQKANTSYGTYIAVLTEIEKVINQIRAQKCRAIFNQSYYDLDANDPKDIQKIQLLATLVPERIYEPAIKN